MIYIAKLTRSVDLRIIITALLYILASQISLNLTFASTKLAAYWFPAGLSLALIISMGPRIWPGIAIGALTASLQFFIYKGIPLDLNSLLTAAIVTIASTLEAVIGYYVVLKFIKRKNPFERTNEVFGFILTACLCSAIYSIIYSSGFFVNGYIPRYELIEFFVRTWAASLMSLLIICPMILSWTNDISIKVTRRLFTEGIIFLGGVALLIFLLTYNPMAVIIEKSLPYILIPFILWMAFRANLQITLIGIFALSMITLYFTINNYGPFSLAVEKNSLTIIQIYLSIVLISAMVLNATNKQRAVAEKALKSFNESLEDRIQQRTKDLKDEIIARKATEEKMRLANRKLRHVNSELDSFVYSVSHDLRAPIASVLGLVNVAKKESSVKDMQLYLEMIEKSAEQQDKFIKDILDISRNARLEVVGEAVKFDPLVNEVLTQLKYYDDAKNVKRHIAIDQNIDFKSDKKRLKVILNNLISNAIRYSNGKNPTIDININVTESIAKIIISDNGIGISKKHQEKVCKMFYRATDDNAGSGLGLYIVKETIDKLRGSFSIKSEENQGTVVTIEIPNLSETSELLEVANI